MEDYIDNNEEEKEEKDADNKEIIDKDGNLIIPENTDSEEIPELNPDEEIIIGDSKKE